MEAWALRCDLNACCVLDMASVSDSSRIVRYKITISKISTRAHDRATGLKSDSSAECPPALRNGGHANAFPQFRQCVVRDNRIEQIRNRRNGFLRKFFKKSIIKAANPRCPSVLSSFNGWLYFPSLYLPHFVIGIPLLNYLKA